MTYSTVLVAIDLSDEAGEVLAAARRIADQSGAALHCVAVVTPLTNVYGGLDLAPLAAGAASFEVSAMRQARERVATLCEEFGILSERQHVRLGAAAAEIKLLAEQLKTDLIVLGTHGKHGLGLLLGSTANAVLHGVPCDVLAIRIHAAAASKEQRAPTRTQSADTGTGGAAERAAAL